MATETETNTSEASTEEQEVKTPVATVTYAQEHDILKRIRTKAKTNREFNDEVIVPSLGVKVRMSVLSHDDLSNAQASSGTTLTRRNAADMSFAFELVTRAITHVDDVPIEDLFPQPLVGPKNSLSEFVNARAIARDQIKVYWRETLSTEDIVFLSSHYSVMTQRRIDVIEKVSKTSKNASAKVS